MGEGLLAKRPPSSTLIALLIYAAIASGAFAIVRYFVDESARLFAASQGGVVWIRYGFVIAIGLVGLFLVAACVRIILRWTSSARIAIEGGELVLRIPKRRSWWMLIQTTVVETRIRIAEIRALRVLPHRPAVLEIEASQTIEIPSKLFATGVYTIDAALREAIGSGAWPHPTARLESLATWKTSHVVSVVMPIVGLALVASGIAIAGLLALDGGKLGFLPFLLGLGLLIAVAFYRGRIILDARGMFFERGGTTTYLAWSEIDPATFDVRSNLLGAWQELRVASAKTSTAPQVISLNRILGLGFPLGKIAGQLCKHAPKYR